MRNNILKGRVLNIIEPIGGLVAGQQKTYDLHITGGIISITNKKDVEAIDNAIIEAKRIKKMCPEADIIIEDYVAYMIENEDILN